jgi:peptidyl-tRNA hydrolase
MTLEEIKQWIEQNKDSEEVKNYIGGLVTTDRVETFLGTEEGKKLIQPKLDTYHNKGLESWKKNNLDKLVDEEVKKRFPEKDPKDIEIENMKREMENIKKEAARKELMTKAIQFAGENKIPSKFIDRFLGEDEDSTFNALKEFQKEWTTTLQSNVEERLKAGYKPPQGGAGGDKTPAQLAAEARNSKAPTGNNDPWASK